MVCQSDYNISLSNKELVTLSTDIPVLALENQREIKAVGVLTRLLRSLGFRFMLQRTHVRGEINILF